MKQSQKQTVHVNVVVNETKRKKSRSRRKRAKPSRPITRHIIPPTIQVVQERWFMQPSQPLPPPQVPQSSTGHTMIPEKDQIWGVSSTSPPTHPFAFATPVADPPTTPMKGLTPIPLLPPVPVDEAAESPSRERNVFPTSPSFATPIPMLPDFSKKTKAQIISILNGMGIKGVNALPKEALLSIINSSDPHGEAQIAKTSKKTRFTPY